LILNQGLNCKTAVTFLIGVHKNMKKNWKAKNMSNSNMPIDEIVRDKKYLTIVLLINEMKNIKNC
jgi:hypothetical protein